MLFVAYSQYDPLDLNVYITKTVLDKNNQKQEKKNNKIDFKKPTKTKKNKGHQNA